MGKFVVLAAPRTGSNRFCTMLNSHPDILCHHELFNPDKISYAISIKDSAFEVGSLAERDKDPETFIAKVWRESLGHKCVGFKLNRGQHRTAFRTVIEDNSIHKILITRRNRIRTFISEIIASTTGEWESFEWSPANAKKIKVTVKIDELISHIKLNDQYFSRICSQISAHGGTWVEISYEDLESPRELKNILDLLEVEEFRLSSATTKQNSDNLEELIANFDELSEILMDPDLRKELVGENQ